MTGLADSGQTVDAGSPRHIAFIPDGNRRWARGHDYPLAVGHERGEQVLFAVVDACVSRGVDWLTFFMLSTDNWSRAADELDYLISGKTNLLHRMIVQRTPEMMARNVRFRMIGNRTGNIPPATLQAVEETERATADNTGLTLVAAIDYGGREEILRAASRMDGAPGGADGPASMSRSLDLANMPDIDLLIRTSGVRRLSNFTLWQLAYAELAFVDALWPDFDEQMLQACLDEYRTRERRYGR